MRVFEFALSGIPNFSPGMIARPCYGRVDGR
jgi:hypothetical protein